MSAEENVEILDEDGNKTGQVLTRTEAHKRSLRHPVVNLWVYNSCKNDTLRNRYGRTHGTQQ
jgi:hypothetical protein